MADDATTAAVATGIIGIIAAVVGKIPAPTRLGRAIQRRTFVLKRIAVLSGALQKAKEKKNAARVITLRGKIRAYREEVTALDMIIDHHENGYEPDYE